MLFSLLGKSFEMWYIINTVLEGVFLFILSMYVTFDIHDSMYTVYTMNTVCAVCPICQTNCVQYRAFSCMHFGNMNYSLRDVSVRK